MLGETRFLEEFACVVMTVGNQSTVAEPDSGH
jgi:hypothetical protein